MSRLQHFLTQENTNCSQGEKKIESGDSTEQTFIYTLQPPYLLVNIPAVKPLALERGIQNVS